MSPLIPNFHPLLRVLIVSFFLLCLFFGGEQNTEVIQAAWPVVALGGAVAAGAIKSAIDAKAQKKAIEAQKESDEARLEAIEQDYGPLVEAARERQADPESYEISEASKREKLAQVKSDIESQTKGAEAELLRDQGPYGSGKKFQMMDFLQKRRADALAGARLGIERESDYFAEAKKRADEGLMIDYAKTKAGMPSTVPQFQGFGSRLLGQIGGGIMAGASGGMFGTMGGGDGSSTDVDPDPENPIDDPNIVGK